MGSSRRPLADRNFDTMAEKFETRIYGTFKGKLRLELLEEDLAFLHAQDTPLQVWDAGCGSGRMVTWFAQAGHRVIGCDISTKMLDRARRRLIEAGCDATLHPLSAQELAPRLPQQDLVLFHAVIEWLAEPMETLSIVADRVRPGGYLSLMFFNEHALVYRNVLRGTWRLKFVLDEAWRGRGKNLTPPWPQKPEAIAAWAREHGFETVRHTGIRVFHDYLYDDAREATSLEELHALERRYCRRVPYRDLGRYVHLLLRRDVSSEMV
jgi:S-adenosylmethionine-dependent methyltransferase